MVTETSIITEFGALGPLTESGTIIVNNVSTSCCEYHQTLALVDFDSPRWLLPTQYCSHCPSAGSLVACDLP